MRFSELVFDASGQSQRLVGHHVLEKDGAITADGEYICWFRRARRHALTPTELQRAEGAEGAFVYWVIGEDGLVLTTSVYEEGVESLIHGRVIHETEADYNARTNYGAF